MPTLDLRRVGMSHIVEKIHASGLDGRALLASTSKSFGPAVAPLGAPTDPEGDAPPIDALILDRKAATWDALRAWLEGWVAARGCRYVTWAEDGRSKGSAATLHFHE